MTVVKMGFKRAQRVVGSGANDVDNAAGQPPLIMQPGAEPPMVVPYCGICDQPADRIQFDIPTDGAGTWRVGVHGQCCGQTRSAWLSTEDVWRIRRTNEKFILIPAKGHAQTIKEQKKRGPG